MKPARVVLAIALAFALDTTLTRFIRGIPAVELLLIVVVYVALRSGPVTGLLAGAMGGLAQDYGLANGIIGIGGLAKTTVGFLAGKIGTQFIVAQPFPRFIVFFGATVLSQAMTIGLGVLLDLRPLGTPYAEVVGEALVNATIGVVWFQLAELLPRVAERHGTKARK